MANLGIDVGAQSVKAAIVADGKALALAKVRTGFDQEEAAEHSVREVLQQSGISRQELERIVATGIGRKSIARVTTSEINEFLSAAKGGFFVFPSARTIIDVGAEEARAVRLDQEGNVRDYVRNDKCAAGAGSFVEAMAKALRASLDEFVQLSQASTKESPINAQCVIFAESEVVSLVHGGSAREDIARAVHDGIAERVSTLARRVRLENDVVLIGGMAKNAGFVKALSDMLKVDILAPEDAEYISAIGAAIFD
jgi:predicted CoA-substrate-specific enzyme activase